MDVLRLVETQPQIARVFTISHYDSQRHGGLELLANGLTFDLSGCTPQVAQDVPSLVHRYGLDASAGLDELEAITLKPGAHLAGGGHLLPVVRSMAGVAAALVALPGVAAVAWHPAHSQMGPDYFARVIARWLDGGPFPALGLTALARKEDGAVESEGLAFFTGQELRIEPAGNLNPAQAAKVAIRLINSLVSISPIQSPCEFTGPEGERLNAEPIGNGRVIRVWRQG